MNSYKFYIILWVLLGISNKSSSQHIFLYDSLNSKFGIVSDGFLGPKKFKYPATGIYSPTMWARNNGKILGTGISNYIYFNVNSKIKPGVPYTIKLKVKMKESFLTSKFFNTHFGIAFCNALPADEEYGLWFHSYTKLCPEKIDTVVEISFNFRALCKPKYVVIGVFDDANKEDLQESFGLMYKYTVHKVEISESESNEQFKYVCNEFEEEQARIAEKTAWRDTSIYFSQGSFEIDPMFDSIFYDIKQMKMTKQDIIYLEAFTNKSGDRNVLLGEQRNNAVLKKLIDIGIDTARIIMKNYDEQKAISEKGEKERKVRIKISNDRLYQKYYVLFRKHMGSNIGLSKTYMNKWLAMVPPPYAIFALFDCYNEENNSKILMKDVYKKIKEKFYKNKNLEFELDSLWCEDQKMRTLETNIRMNHLSTDYMICEFQKDENALKNLESKVEAIYLKHGFPDVKKYGKRANTTIPFVIIHSENIKLQEKFLPLFLDGAEQKKISWTLYATLYDKISIIKTGLQRYGTQIMVNEKRELGKLYPFEDEEKVKEYRKQVGLGPLSDI